MGMYVGLRVPRVYAADKGLRKIDFHPLIKLNLSTFYPRIVSILLLEK